MARRVQHAAFNSLFEMHIVPRSNEDVDKLFFQFSI